MRYIYRILQHDSYRTTECAFTTSLKKAVEYISAQLNPDTEWGGHKDRDWVYDKALLPKTLKEGYHWGEMWGLKSFSVEKILLQR